MHPWMLPAMQHHGRSLREALPADVANVRPFADVRQQMDLLRAQTPECLPANRAQIRFLPGMSPQMLGEAVFALELHTALLANVFDLVQFHVTVKILLRLELLLTRLTLKLLHLSLVLVMFMEVEGAFARIRGATYIADARFGVVILHVGRVIRLHLEHLSALFAFVIVILRVFSYVMDLKVGFGACFEVAQAARVQIDRLVVNLHVPG